MIELNVLCFLLTLSCNCNLPANKNLKGNVKIVKEYEIKSDTILNSVSYFNTFGNIDSLRYSPYNVWEYNYDDNKRCVLETHGKDKRERIYFNNLIVEKYYQDGVLRSITKNYFDRNCQLDSSVIFNPPFVIAYRKFVIRYDDKNRLIEESDLLLHVTHKYLYSNNKVIQEKSYFSDSYDIYNFNSQGDIIEHYRYLNNDSILFGINYSYKYDFNNNWIEKEEIESFQDSKIKILKMRKIVYY